MSYLANRANIWIQQWRHTERFDWRATLAILIGGIVLWPLTNLLPMLGYDWYIYFWLGDFRQYPAWVEWALAPLLALEWRSGLALLNAIMFMSVAVAASREVYKRAPAITRAVTLDALFSALLALCTLPVLTLAWVGNIDGLALFGFVSMPAGIVWLTLKPHLGFWAMLSRRSWLLWAILFCSIMLLISPGWPMQLIGSLGQRLQHPSAFGWASLGWWMIPVGLVLLMGSSADPIVLMAAGSFLSPFLMPQHFVLLTPAFGRVSGIKRIVMWLTSLLLIFPMGITGIWGGSGKALALVYPLTVWLILRKTQTGSLAKMNNS
jgi:hypothetical protein